MAHYGTIRSQWRLVRRNKNLYNTSSIVHDFHSRDRHLVPCDEDSKSSAMSARRHTAHSGESYEWRRDYQINNQSKYLLFLSCTRSCCHEASQSKYPTGTCAGVGLVLPEASAARSIFAERAHACRNEPSIIVHTFRLFLFGRVTMVTLYC